MALVLGYAYTKVIHLLLERIINVTAHCFLARPSFTRVHSRSNIYIHLPQVISACIRDALFHLESYRLHQTGRKLWSNIVPGTSSPAVAESIRWSDWFSCFIIRLSAQNVCVAKMWCRKLRLEETFTIVGDSHKAPRIVLILIYRILCKFNPVHGSEKRSEIHYWLETYSTVFRRWSGKSSKMCCLIGHKSLIGNIKDLITFLC